MLFHPWNGCPERVTRVKHFRSQVHLLGTSPREPWGSNDERGRESPFTPPPSNPDINRASTTAWRDPPHMHAIPTHSDSNHHTSHLTTTHQSSVDYSHVNARHRATTCPCAVPSGSALLKARVHRVQ